MHSITQELQKELLSIAKNAIVNKVTGEQNAASEKKELYESDIGGIFVTIKMQGILRGCIGRLEPGDLTTDLIKEVALSASFDDPRFSSISEEELNEIDIEISILSHFEKTENIEEIIIGTHGLFIKRDYHQGLLLTQVATEHNMDRIEFLEHTCIKAGLGKDQWREDETEIYKFTSLVFGEKNI